MRQAASIMIVFLLVLMASGLLLGQGSTNITLLDQLDQYTSYNDIWGYSANGRDYALLGVNNRTSIVDITDGSNAVEVAFITSPTSSWKDIKTYQNYAYAVTEAANSVQIIDLGNLPNSATLVATVSIFQTNPHNIFIDEAAGLLYGSEDFNFNNSVKVFSLADPLNPLELASFGPDSHDMFARDNTLFVAEGGQGSIGIYDMINPSNPQLVERIQIPAAGYVHNVWTTADNNFLMSTEETSGKTVKMWDISDPGNSELLDTYLAPNNLAHNVTIDGDYAYLSHYGSGLRILNITNPNNIVEEGFYNTPNAWGVYPYYSDNKVVVSDINSGLYVFAFDAAGGSDIPCVDISSFVGRCNNAGTLQARVRFNTPAHNGKTVELTIDGTDVHTLTIQNSRAQIALPNYATGAHTISLTEPAGCVNDIVTTCQPPSIADGGLFSSETIPATLVLDQNYPNPFNPSTSIRFGLPADQQVRLTVYDLLGQEVVTLANESMAAGYHTFTWNGQNATGQVLSSGIYIYKLTAGESSQVKRMMYSK